MNDPTFTFTTQPNTPQSMVEDFHWTFGLPVDNRDFDTLSTRRRLIAEEYDELRTELVVAHKALVLGDPIPNLAAIAKEMGDLLYVVFGAAVEFGIDAEEAFRRIHESNMSKLADDGQPVKKDGKILKGPNYTPPDMTGTYREEDNG